MSEHIQLILSVLGVIVVGISLLMFYKSKQTEQRRHRKNVLFAPTSKLAVHDPASTPEPIFSDDSDVKLVDKPTRKAPTPKSTPRISPIVSVSVMAKPGLVFSSYELLQAITNAGFHFGEMNIFHHYAGPARQGVVLYSLASAIKPGTFALDNMGAFSTPGLTLFMDASTLQDPIDVFRRFITSAYQLADELQGVLYEKPNQPWTDASYHAFEDHLYDIMEQYRESHIRIPLDEIKSI